MICLLLVFVILSKISRNISYINSANLSNYFMIQFYKERIFIKEALRFYDKGLAGVWKTPASLTLDIQSNDTKYFFVIFQIFFEFIKLSLHIILSVWSILTTLFRMPCLQSALSFQLPLYLFPVFTAFFMHHMGYYTFYIVVVLCLPLLYWKFHKAVDAILVIT